MLPFSLKLVWFVLTLLGLVPCWVVLTAFAISVDALWLLIFSAAVTVLEGVFCLGMIWKMDPFLMPKSFCIAQAVIINVAVYVLTGVCASFTHATSICVLRPWANSGRQTLAWRSLYYIPIVVFPIAATAADIAVIIKLDAVHPTDDLHCDASNPIWVRFLGYAGAPLILTIPSFILSTISAARLIKAYRHSCRIPHPRTYADTPPIVKSIPVRTAPLQVHIQQSRTTSNEQEGLPPTSAIASTVPGKRASLPIPPLAFRLSSYQPFTYFNDLDLKDLAGHTEPDKGLLSLPNLEYQEPPGRLSGAASDEGNLGKDNDDDGDGDDQTNDDGHRNTLRGWSEPPYEKGKKEVEETEITILSSTKWDNAGSRLSKRPSVSKRKSMRLGPAVWRMVLFQLCFFSFILLASVSTVIDVIKRRSPPTAFGTQHIALLLAPWGPFIVFGHYPGVIQRLKFWRR